MSIVANVFTGLFSEINETGGTTCDAPAVVESATVTAAMATTVPSAVTRLPLLLTN
jgi:hypothetical protein